MAIFEKADFWGLKNHLEVRVQHETCSTICGTPVPAILNLGPAPLEGLLGPNSKLFSKIAIFCWFWAKIGGSLTREWLVKLNFLIKEGG